MGAPKRSSGPRSKLRRVGDAADRQIMHRDGGAEQFIGNYTIFWFQRTLLFFVFGLQAGDFL